jgi:hypothetical protein
MPRQEGKYHVSGFTAAIKYGFSGFPPAFYATIYPTSYKLHEMGISAVFKRFEPVLDLLYRNEEIHNSM